MMTRKKILEGDDLPTALARTALVKALRETFTLTPVEKLPKRITGRPRKREPDPYDFEGPFSVTVWKGAKGRPPKYRP